MITRHLTRLLAALLLAAATLPALAAPSINYTNVVPNLRVRTNAFITSTLTVTGVITNSALTASTVVTAGTDKKLTSLANGSGVLTNDGSGGLSWVTVGSASNWSASGTTNSTLAGVASAYGATLTNYMTAGIVTATKAFQSYQGSLTHAGTVTLDFDATATVNALSATGSITFAFSNLATNRTYRLKVANPQATNITLTFPATVSTNILGGAPTTLTAGGVAMWSLEAWGTTDGSVMSAWAATK